MNNTLENSKNRLKHLAQYHGDELTNHKEQESPIAEREFKVKEIVTTVKSMDFFTTFDKVVIKESITYFETAVNDLINSSVLTQSRHIKERMPVAFDALVDIFAFSTEEFRQQYFQELITFYYEELCSSLRKSNSEKCLDKSDYDQQVKVLLPLVKLRLAVQLSQQNTLIAEKNNQQLLFNIGLYFKYPRLNQEDIYEVIRNKIGSSNFSLQSYELIPLNEKNGHLGEYFKLKILVYIRQHAQQFDLFAKFLTPKTEGMRKMVLSGPSKKEEFFYMTYIPLLEKYDLNSLLNFAPKCYFSRINDVLILDDMAENGFVGLTPNIKLKFDALRKVVEKIASFHAATMILEEMLSQQEEKKVTINDLYGEFLQEAFFVPDDDYFLKRHFDIGLEAMYYIAQKFPELTKKHSQDFLKDKIHKGWKLHFKQITKSDDLKNTICHGDMYVANMLFKYNEEQICHDVSLIDFQILRYCPPAHDLLFFLHQSCSKEDRNKYQLQLCNEYYEELTKNMISFGFDINKIYPKENFQRSLKYMKSQAVLHSLYYSPVTMIPPKIREDIFSSEEQSKYYLDKYRCKLVDLGMEDDTYKTTMEGLVEDLLEICENGDL